MHHVLLRTCLLVSCCNFCAWTIFPLCRGNFVRVNVHSDITFLFLMIKICKNSYSSSKIHAYQQNFSQIFNSSCLRITYTFPECIACCQCIFEYFPVIFTFFNSGPMTSYRSAILTLCLSRTVWPLHR